MRRVLSVLVENEPGVLSRVAGLFSGRGFNIESLNVAPTLEDGVSLMTITTSGDEQIIEQIVKQLRKLVTVVKVVDFYGMAYVEREMMVIKVHAEESKRGEVLRIADIFRCKVVDVSLTDLTLEATGDHSKLQAIIQLLQKFGIKELARTGYAHIAFSVGSKEKVDALTIELKTDGYEVISGPRTTGDGYYESCIVAVEDNQIEITV